MLPVSPVRAQRWADMAEELAGVGYWRMDAATEAIRWSPNMYKIFGIDPSVVPSLAYAMQFVHPEDRAGADASLEGNLAGASGATVTRIVRPSGEIRYVEGRNGSEFGPGGEVLAVYGTMFDITDRRASQLALADSERRYRLLAENATDVTFCFQPDGTLTFVTPAVRRLLGYEPAELIGRTTFDIMHPGDHNRVRQAFSDYVSLGPGAPPIRIEFRASTKEGRELWLEAHPRTLFDAAGDLVEVQDVIRDITASKEMKRELVAAKEAAEGATAAKAEFLSNISHELRTPLTAIVGYSGLLAETCGLSDQARLYAARIDGASQSLLALVNGILDFSRIEAGRVVINRWPASPARTARECLDLLALQAKAKGIALSFDEAAGVPASLLIDPDAYRQVLINLIGNAVKFTDSGEVRLSIRYDSKDGFLLADVADTGPGIGAGEQEKLFVRFSQVDGGATRRHEGAGLGLAICKGLVEAMGGAIHVVSQPGAGAVFSFRIPARTTVDAAKGAGATMHLAPGRRVLICDDNQPIREMTRAMLEAWGVDTSEASDGESGIAAALSQPFDLILVDLRMPGVTGLDVVAALRARPGPNISAPIIAYTASGSEHDAAFYERAGFDAVLGKPVIAQELMAMVAQFTGVARNDRAA